MRRPRVPEALKPNWPLQRKAGARIAKRLDTEPATNAWWRAPAELLGLSLVGYVVAQVPYGLGPALAVLGVLVEPRITWEIQDVRRRRARARLRKQLARESTQ